MDTAPNVFISFNPEQKNLELFMCELLEDMGFTCLALEKDQHASIEEARSLMQQADCFIGLLTPDKRTEDGRTVCLESINIQLGLAYDAGIPMQLFAFDHVDTSNIVAPLSDQIVKMQQTRTKFGLSIIFDTNNIRLLFKTLLVFRSEAFTPLILSEKM